MLKIFRAHSLNIPAIGQDKRALLWLCSGSFADARSLLSKAARPELALTTSFAYAGKRTVLRLKEKSFYRLLQIGLFNTKLSNLFVASLFEQAELQSDYALTRGLSMRQISDRILPLAAAPNRAAIEANESRALSLIQQALPATEESAYPNLRSLLTCRRTTAEYRLTRLSA